MFRKFNKPVLSKESRVRLVTHNDLDGSGPAVILKSLFQCVDVTHCGCEKMSAEILKAVKDDHQYDKIFVTDLSCNERDAAEIDALPGRDKLVLLDHHATALGLNRYSWALVEPMLIPGTYRDERYKEKLQEGHSSGTTLLYDYLSYFDLIDSQNQTMKDFVWRVGAYDTWDWVNLFQRDEECNALNDVFHIYGAERFDELFSERLKTGSELINEQDRLLLTLEREKIEKYVQNKMKTLVKGTVNIEKKKYSIVYGTAENYMAQVFSSIRELYPDYQIAVLFTGNTVSLRSIDPTVNVGEIAKHFGGGGHPAAAGFKKSLNQKDTIRYLFESSFEG